MKMRQKMNETIKRCLFIGTVAAITIGVYFNAIYYERHRRKNQRTRDPFC